MRMILPDREDQWFYIPERIIEHCEPDQTTSMKFVTDLMRSDALKHNRLHLRGVL